MARAVLRDIVFGLAATGLLIGCVDGGGKAADGSATGMVAAPGKKSGAKDVEAPEVFQATDSALWDGRPSLGGIWVASPDVENPERVVMFNPATGKSITGALFKRERDNPGPRLQLSSDAAEALGILAGQPTEIRVTALRKEAAAKPVAVEAAAPAATDPAATDPAAKDGDAAAIASAALDAVDTGKKTDKPAAKPAAKPAKDGETTAAAAAAGTAAVVAEGAADGAAAVVDEKPRKKTWKERRAEAKAAREAKKKAAADAKAAAAAAGTAVAAEGEAPTTTPGAVAVAPIESAPLDAREPEGTAPAETKKPKRKTVGDTAAAAPAVAAPPAPEAPAATGPARPIQVASFSKEDNAKRATEALAKIGVTATPQKSEAAGKAVWGVVVMGDAAMLKKIKDAGFADAYFLK
jgi:hypothetical protein